MDDLKRIVQEKAAQYWPETQQIRHHLHAHPELSFQEKATAKFVAEKLKSYGLSPQEGVAGTGVVALIQGEQSSSQTVALRADMDALPITEQNEVPYKSINPGVMHACGHDVHTACLLATARILAEIKDQLPGTVKLIFQPGEEKAPGGASLMIKDGVLLNPAPQHIIGQHVMPFLPVGTVGFREGMYMASADELYVTVTGKGGHAAMPEKNIDPVLISAHILVALQQIISRHRDPRQPSVLSFGKVIANGATNVIPDQVSLAGTFRAMNEEWREKALNNMKKMAVGIAESMGGQCDFDIVKGYPFLENDPALTKKMRMAAEDLLGKDKVVDLDLWLAAEDFAFYSHHLPACFYRLGTRNEAKGITSGVHTPTFDIDEQALQIGTALMTWLAVSSLKN